MPYYCCFVAGLSLNAGEADFDIFGVGDGEGDSANGVRLKDLVTIDGVRDNQLHGIGIVVGLDGTGDSGNATLRLAQQMLATKNIRIGDNDLRSQAIAMVAVTADLPPFSRQGTRLETLVSAIGNASSLRGGVLLQTFLTAPNGDIYTAAQGPLTIGGFGEAGPGMVAVGNDHNNIETVAQVANGAIVERELPVGDHALRRLSCAWCSKTPDFTNATRIANVSASMYGRERVRAQDAATIALSFAQRPQEDPVGAHHQRLVPTAHLPGCGGAGGDQCPHRHRGHRPGCAHWPRRPEPRRPGPAGESPARIYPRPRRSAQSPGDRNLDRPYHQYPPRRKAPEGIQPTDVTGSVTVMDGTTVQSIANALNAIGARPRDMVAIFQALKRAGALHAELVIM